MPQIEKQAVLLIHGIGEQRPMQTLRGFVDAVWSQDEAVHHPFARADVFSKPDTVSGSFELRRLTTTKNRQNVRTDFFEYYWAHLMEGTSAHDVLAWAKILLLRSPGTVPPPLRGAWITLIVLSIVLLLLIVQTVLPPALQVVQVPAWFSGITGLLVALIAMPIIKNIVGDAARYLNAAPNNVKRRQEIRTKGVELLEKLHQAGYERIIVVGHSLGTVIGYDLLTYAWAQHSEKLPKSRKHPMLDALEEELAAGTLDVTSYRKRQRELADELQQAEGQPTWRVTDFVTLGSPLAHAAVLLAQDADDLKERQRMRELPTCPPQLEDGRISFPPDAASRRLHHAAVFGPCRWTNLYFPARYLIAGDVIGGPLAPVFGGGIKDIQVRTRLRLGLLSHTLYWAPDRHQPRAPHLLALREAVNLLDEPAVRFEVAHEHSVIDDDVAAEQ